MRMQRYDDSANRQNIRDTFFGKPRTSSMYTLFIIRARRESDDLARNVQNYGRKRFFPFRCKAETLWDASVSYFTLYLYVTHFSYQIRFTPLFSWERRSGDALVKTYHVSFTRNIIHPLRNEPLLL